MCLPANEPRNCTLTSRHFPRFGYDTRQCDKSSKRTVHPTFRSVALCPYMVSKQSINLFHVGNHERENLLSVLCTVTKIVVICWVASLCGVGLPTQMALWSSDSIHSIYAVSRSSISVELGERIPFMVIQFSFIFCH